MLSQTNQSSFKNCAANERAAFSERLKQALDAAGYDDMGATCAARLFNYHSPVRVSVHCVRKWLVGGAIPSQAHIKTLSAFLQCDPAWLRFGTATAPVLLDEAKDVQDRVLLGELASFDEATRMLVYKFVAMLVRDASARRMGRR